jgi:hypothetical protein
MGLYSIKVMLILFNLDGNGRNIVVELTIMCDLLCQPLVIDVSHSLLEYLEVTPWASEHMLEPRGKGLEG